MKGRKVYIYALIDPRNNEIRYIGKTIKLLHHRLKGHMNESIRYANVNIHKERWIRSLYRIDLLPIIEKLDCIDSDIASLAEISWITYASIELECDLTNVTIGGEGVIGRVVSEYTRERLSESHTGLSWSATRRAAYEANPTANSGENHPMFGRRGELSPNYGRPCKEETKNKISSSLMGEKHPLFGKHPIAETRKKCSDSLKEYHKNNPEAVEVRKLCALGNKSKTGQKDSEETRRKKRESRLRYLQNRDA